MEGDLAVKKLLNIGKYRTEDISKKAHLCSAYKAFPDAVVTCFVHDESTRRGCLVLYKEVTTVYSSVGYITDYHGIERDIKGRIVCRPPTIHKVYEKPLFTVEQ